jgi:hypothetical protein
MTKRPLVILAADGTMVAVLRAFFERVAYFDSLGCALIEGFDPRHDIFNVPGSTDGATHLRAHETLRPRRPHTERAIVILDAQFGGDRPAAEVRTELLERLRPDWGDDVDVIVIDPEIEVWLWMDNPNVERALGWKGPGKLRDQLAAEGVWPRGVGKPTDPKDAIQAQIRKNRLGTATRAYVKIAESVSPAPCTDPSFDDFRARLRAWFPREEE